MEAVIAASIVTKTLVCEVLCTCVDRASRVLIDVR